jgi:hypothetical protein
MRTVTPTATRDTLSDTVIPAMRDALTTAREKSAELLDSDVAHEARRRGLAVVKAAKGEAVVAPTRRGWRFGLGMIALGTCAGAAIMWLVRRLGTPVESYTHTMPVPSGTDGGTATGTTSTEDIDLRSGAPTRF